MRDPMVLPCEGDGARREGRQASQCLDSTVEAGEQSPERTPWREARHREHGIVAETYTEYLEIR